MTKAEQKRAVERRTHERLAARKEAAQRGVETRRRKRGAQGKPQSAKAQEPALPWPRRQPRSSNRRWPRSRRSALSATSPRLRSGQARRRGAIWGRWRRSRLRGEQAERFRALAAKEELTLAKLLVRMMEVFEAQVG